MPRVPINIEVFKFSIRCAFVLAETQDMEEMKNMREKYVAAVHGSRTKT